MKEKQTRDLDKSAKEHHRSTNRQIKKPTPFDWKQKISSKFIKEAIDEGRE